jgi:hypothetical protein
MDFFNPGNPETFTTTETRMHRTVNWERPADFQNGNDKPGCFASVPAPPQVWSEKMARQMRIDPARGGRSKQQTRRFQSIMRLPSCANRETLLSQHLNAITKRSNLC